MGTFFAEHSRGVLWSLVLHGTLVAAVSVGIDFTPRSTRTAPPQPIIEATMVDSAVIEREMARIEEYERREIERRQQEEREAREAAASEQARLDELRREREREEQAQLAAEQRRQVQLAEQRERDERERQEREAAAEAERQRLAELQHQREEEERRRQKEAERQRLAAEAEARERERRETELAAALAEETERRNAEHAGLRDEYIRLIQNRIEVNWLRPASAVAGVECVVNVTQIPSGDVIDVEVGECNGDAAVVRSIEAAVRKASPLPRPPVPALYERNIAVVFKPDD